MKTRLTVYDFSDGLEDSFSNEGIIALFEYFERLEDDLGHEIEYDPIAIKCEFTEYADLEEIKSTYWHIETIDEVYQNTLVIEFQGGIIIQDF